jgi:uncharacterized membrane protein (UPF0127 family)
MSSFFRFLKRLLASLASATPAEQNVRLRVVNVTRRIQIASCIDVAYSSAKRSKGLLGRNGLAPGEGLWISPCESVHTFFMRFSIDLVYLDREHRIRKIRRDVPPWRISACLTAHSVLELAAGALQEQDAQPGDVLEFSPADTECVL